MNGSIRTIAFGPKRRHFMPLDEQQPRRHLLVISNATCTGAELFREIRERASEAETEVLIVAPALTSRLHWWMSDGEVGMEAAQQRLTISLEHCAAAGIPARGAHSAMPNRCRQLMRPCGCFTPMKSSSRRTHLGARTGSSGVSGHMPASASTFQSHMSRWIRQPRAPTSSARRPRRGRYRRISRTLGARAPGTAPMTAGSVCD